MLEERNRARWILANGADAEATVVAVEETGWSQADGIGIEIRLDVRIEPRGGAAYDATGREWVARSKKPKAGDRIAVRYDPREPFAWAWAGSVERRSRIHQLDIARLHPAEQKDDRLQTLAELHDRGILSEAEYELEAAAIADEL
jgi:hypothetical protein